MLKSSLCDLSQTYILIKTIILINFAGWDVAAWEADRNNEQVEILLHLLVI